MLTCFTIVLSIAGTSFQTVLCWPAPLPVSRLACPGLLIPWAPSFLPLCISLVSVVILQLCSILLVVCIMACLLDINLLCVFFLFFVTGAFVSKGFTFLDVPSTFYLLQINDWLIDWLFALGSSICHSKVARFEMIEFHYSCTKCMFIV